MTLKIDPAEELFAQVQLLTRTADEIDISGFSKIKCRLQHGAADEFTISLPAQDVEGVWRADLPIWQVGGGIHFLIGYNGILDIMQSFEIVSTTVNYPSGMAGETMTIRAVSDLVRAARNKAARSFLPESTYLDIVDEICVDYGWIAMIDATEITNTPLKRGEDLLAKKSGVSDLTFLKSISKRIRMGDPRLTVDGELIMPAPVVGDLAYARGISELDNVRKLHALSMNREGGQATRVTILAQDAETKEFVETTFEAGEFGGDPDVVYEGPKSLKALELDPSTYTLALAVTEQRGQGKNERVDVISMSQFKTKLGAEELAKIWFEFREKFGRWATATVDGTFELKPFVSVMFDGNMAAVDKSAPWLPMWVEHTVDSGGWKSQMRVIRIVEEPAPLEEVEREK